MRTTGVTSTGSWRTGRRTPCWTGPTPADSMQASFRGHAEILAFWRRFLEAFDEIRFEIDDPVEVEDGVLIVENLAYLRGRDGIEVQARSAWLITIRDGKTTSLTLYQTK